MTREHVGWGTKIYYRLAGICGAKAALKLLEEFGGRQIYIPTVRTVLKKQRDRNIRADYESGVSIDALARQHKVTPRRIRQILKAPYEEKNDEG